MAAGWGLGAAPPGALAAGLATPPMAALPAALLPAGAATGHLLAWRIDAERFAPQWDSGIGAELYGGRWNPKGQRAVYCSLDPATCLVEAAVHRGFAVLDTQPHVLSCVQITLGAEAAGPAAADRAGASPATARPTAAQPADASPAIRVVQPGELPNPAWLHGGTPSAGQQQFGGGLLLAHGIVLLPSAVSKCSWNLVLAPAVAAGRYRLLHQQRLVVDTRLHPAG